MGMPAVREVRVFCPTCKRHWLSVDVDLREAILGLRHARIVATDFVLGSTTMSLCCYDCAEMRKKAIRDMEGILGGMEKRKPEGFDALELPGRGDLPIVNREKYPGPSRSPAHGLTWRQRFGKRHTDS